MTLADRPSREIVLSVARLVGSHASAPSSLAHALDTHSDENTSASGQLAASGQGWCAPDPSTRCFGSLSTKSPQAMQRFTSQQRLVAAHPLKAFALNPGVPIHKELLEQAAPGMGHGSCAEPGFSWNGVEIELSIPLHSCLLLPIEAQRFTRAWAISGSSSVDDCGGLAAAVSRDAKTDDTGRPTIPGDCVVSGATGREPCYGMRGFVSASSFD